MGPAAWHALKCEAVRWARANNPTRAIECLLQAIELTRSSPELIGETGTMQNYLADLYLQEGQLTLAENAIRDALQNRSSLPAEERSLAADDLMILAKVLSKQGKHRQAFEAGNRGLSLARKQPGSHREVIGQMRELVKELRRNLTRAEREGQTPVAEAEKLA